MEKRNHWEACFGDFVVVGNEGGGARWDGASARAHFLFVPSTWGWFLCKRTTAVALHFVRVRIPKDVGIVVAIAAVAIIHFDLQHHHRVNGAARAVAPMVLAVCSFYSNVQLDCNCSKTTGRAGNLCVGGHCKKKMQFISKNVGIVIISK